MRKLRSSRSPETPVEFEMRIDRLDIRNFRCFAERTFSFNPKFTLLVGSNASGKTAILEVLTVALGAALIPVPDAPTRPIHRRDVRRTYRPMGETGHFVEHYPARIEASGSLDGKEFKWVRALRTAKSRTTRGETRSIRKAMETLVHQARDDDTVVLPYLGYYGTGRLWQEQRRTPGGSVEPGGPLTRYGGYRNCLKPGSSARNLIAWIKRLAFIQTQRRNRLETLRSVYEVIARCVENAVASEFDFDEDDLVVEFDNRLRVPFRLLSDGQRNMAATVADIAMRCSQLNPHLNERAHLLTPGIVLIDELDLHLHPRWQRDVVKSLCESFPRLQFVATSHSPFIVQSVSPGGVINLDKETDAPETPSEQSIEDVAENIMGVAQPQRSKRFQDMVDAAERYFRVIESSEEEEDPQVVQGLREQLDELEEPFADNPAYVAFLRLQRTARNLR